MMNNKRECTGKGRGNKDMVDALSAVCLSTFAFASFKQKVGSVMFRRQDKRTHVP
jgi:hypothetical protein